MNIFYEKSSKVFWNNKDCVKIIEIVNINETVCKFICFSNYSITYNESNIV